MRALSLLTISLGLAAAAGCRTASTQGESEAKLVGGTEALDHEYPSVLIWTTADSPLTKSYCTGTKIGANLLLTAAHCVLLQDDVPNAPYTGRWHRIASMGPGKEIKYSRERRLAAQTPHQRLKIVKLHLPPAVDNCLAAAPLLPECTGRMPKPDIAVIEVSGMEGTPFGAMPKSAVEYGRVETGQRITIMGYGMTDDEMNHLPRLKFHRSEVAAPNVLKAKLEGTEAERDGLPDMRLFFGSVGILEGALFANLGSGDSGGPVMRETANGPVVIGVNSDGFCPLEQLECQRTTNSFFQRLDLGAPHGVGEWLSGIAE